MRSTTNTVPETGSKATPAERSTSGRLPGIEGLRALSALGVLTWHVWSHPTLSPVYGVAVGPLTRPLDTARVGVAMFFVLSGFLLYRPFAAAIVRGTPLPSVGRYARHRFLRIAPAYWTVLLAVAVLFQHALLHRPVELLANLTLTQTYVPAYQYDWSVAYGIVPAWSLTVEVAFYVVLPLLVVGAARLTYAGRLSRRAAAGLPVAGLALVGSVSTVVGDELVHSSIWEVGFLAHAHWFAAGMAVALVRIASEDGRGRASRWWPAAALAAVVLPPVAVEGYQRGALSFLDEQSLLVVACAAVLALVVIPHRGPRVARVLEWRPLVSAGVVSYSAFLWHEPILRALRDRHLTHGGALGLGLDLALVLALTAVASAATYRWIERPAMRRAASRDRSLRRSAVARARRVAER